jgi:hypothetical protein
MSSKRPNIAAMSSESSEDRYMDNCQPCQLLIFPPSQSRWTPYLVVGELYNMNSFVVVIGQSTRKREWYEQCQEKDVY